MVPAFAAVLLALLVTLNLRTLLGGKARIRSKELAFFPTPITAKLLACGHAGSAAKLRWIDSFAYFQSQLDRRDDRLPDGSSGFQRLYTTLIALDPHFLPFYQHAALNLGALVGRHDLALGVLLRGTMAMPEVTELWRGAATELVTAFDWERRQPQAFVDFLNQWVDAEATPNGKRMVWDWQAAMARRRALGLEQIAYWQERLRSVAPGSPAADYLTEVMREQLARCGLRELQARADAYRARHGLPPLALAALIDPALGPPPVPWGAVQLDDGQPVLRPDPFGYSWTLWAGVIGSPGLDRFRFRMREANTVDALRSAVIAGAAWPSDLAGVQALGVTLPEPPAGGLWTYADQRLAVAWPTPSSPPWPISAR